MATRDQAPYATAGHSSRGSSQHRQQRHQPYGLWQSTMVARLAVSLTTAVVLLLVGPAAGKVLGHDTLVAVICHQGTGITAAQLGKSAAGLAKPSPLKIVEEGIPRAVALAQLEQEMEDLNVMHKFDRRIERLAMVMPLTDHFDPGITGFAHKHLQEGDQISLPVSIMSELLRKQAEVPWQFELKLVRRRAPGKFEPVDVPAPPKEALVGRSEMPQLSSVVCTILDARSPEQFIFIPDWMMKALRLRPRDIVLYRHKVLTKGGTILLQPHSSEFLKMSNHQAVMETELRHYSAITRGTTVAFRYRKTLYKFNVLECIDTDGKSQEAVCVQDSDVATDFAPALDTPAGRRKPQAAAKRPTAKAEAPQEEKEEEEGEGGEGGGSEEEDEEGGGWGSDEF
ncbi:unnamed protein product [Pylaiella littoralis]